VVQSVRPAESSREASGRAATARAFVDYSRSAMRATLTYTLLRLLLFFAVAIILALCGVHGIMLIVVALIISSIISLLLLSKLRDRMSISLSGRITRFNRKLEAGTRAEDTD
jgi:small-conductance mechanosensitive channel